MTFLYTVNVQHLFSVYSASFPYPGTNLPESKDEALDGTGEATI